MRFTLHSMRHILFAGVLVVTGVLQADFFGGIGEWFKEKIIDPIQEKTGQISLGGMGISNNSAYPIRVTLYYEFKGLNSWVKTSTKELQPGDQDWLSAYFNPLEAEGGVYFTRIKIECDCSENGTWVVMMDELLQKRTGQLLGISGSNYCMTIYLDQNNKYNYAIQALMPGKDCVFEGAKMK